MAAKVALVAHWDWVLYNFRLPLARALHENSCEVVFICPFGEYVAKLQAAGFRCLHWRLRRGSLNPLLEITAIKHLLDIYSREAFDLVHHFTIKPNLYGSLVVWLMKQKKRRYPVVVNTFTGLGLLFSKVKIAKLIRWCMLPLMRFVFRQHFVTTIFQNEQDRNLFLRLHLVQLNNSDVIAGSGVETRHFHPTKKSLHPEAPVVLTACRLLWDKGIKEFVEAARILCNKGIIARFWVAGEQDKGNPACIPNKVIEKWRKEGIVEFLGHRADMPELLRQADIAVLASYHEGVPRFLLEAGATGLPLVATDIEGCRMVVQDGVNGFIVPVGDTQKLAIAIERLLNDTSLRLCMGEMSRKIVTEEFAVEKIAKDYLALYQRLGVL